MVVVHFPVLGNQLPADHGYALYSAISRQLPQIHGVDWLGIELISGVPCGQGIIMLPRDGGMLRLRIPANEYGHVLPLAGKRLDIVGHPIRLGIPTARALSASPSLYSRMVTIKKFTDAEPFLAAARRQIEALQITATLDLPKDDEGRFRRRVVKIHDKIVIGFSVSAHDLNDEHSLRLQTSGLGGRHTMGCGHFNPILHNG